MVVSRVLMSTCVRELPKSRKMLLEISSENTPQKLREIKHKIYRSCLILSGLHLVLLVLTSIHLSFTIWLGKFFS